VLETIRVSKKDIPWGNSHIEIFQRDLLPPDLQQKYHDKITLCLSLAAINLGRIRQMKRIFGFGKEIYIVSEASSEETSPASSQQMSPHSTFPLQGGQEEDSLDKPTE